MPDHEPSLCLGPDDLARLFPAYLEIDRAGAIRSVGPSLAAAGESALPGTTFFDAFSVEHPCDIGTIEELRGCERPLILASISSEGPRLRGVACPRGESTFLLVALIPRIEDASGRATYTFADFSPADGTPDMLLALEFRSGLLADARRLASRLEVERQAASRANAAKTAFLATMSHEIRTPMNGILGIASILADTGVSEEQRELLETMRESGEALMGIISNVLDLSKIEADSLEVEESCFSLPRVIDGVCALFQPIAETKGVRFDRDVAITYPDLVGDAARVRQIAINLLSNAVKFTGSGSVTLRVRDRAEDGGAVCEIAVSDTGIGIGSHALERLFEPFHQADSSTTRCFGGSGLGLAITRRLCEKMGGEVTVESRVGRGSRFTATLPFPVAVPPQAGPSAGDADARLPSFPCTPRVLVVEDNATNRLVVSKYLDRLGIEHAFAHDGVQALTAWEEGGFSTVLMDIQMPNLDGFEATRELRRREQASGRARVAVIGLTADAMLQRRDEAFAVGMDGFLTKPLHFDDLRSAIQAHSPAVPPVGGI